MRLAAIAVLALLSAPAAAQTIVPQTTSCITTEDEFMASAVNVNKAEVRVATDHARVTVLEEINRHRVAAQLWAFEADKLSVGIIQHEGRLYVGVVMFKAGCVVPGSVKVIPAENWVAFIVGLGLSMDDFKPEEGA
jgi:hypothetical protein